MRKQTKLTDLYKSVPRPKQRNKGEGAPKEEGNRQELTKKVPKCESMMPVSFDEFMRFTNVENIVAKLCRENKPKEDFGKYFPKAMRNTYFAFYRSPEIRDMPPINAIRLTDHCPKRIREKIFAIPTASTQSKGKGLTVLNGRKRNAKEMEHKDVAEDDETPNEDEEEDVEDDVLERSTRTSKHPYDEENSKAKKPRLVQSEGSAGAKKAKDSLASPEDKQSEPKKHSRPEADNEYPVPFKFFMQHIDREGLIDEIVRQTFAKSEWLRVKEDREQCIDLLYKFYKDFYEHEECREKYKVHFKACPSFVKAKLLQTMKRKEHTVVDASRQHSESTDAVRKESEGESAPKDSLHVFEAGMPVTLATFRRFTNIDDLVPSACRNIDKTKVDYKIRQAYIQFYRDPNYRPKLKRYLKITNDCPDHVRSKIFEMAGQFEAEGTSGSPYSESSRRDMAPGEKEETEAGEANARSLAEVPNSSECHPKDDVENSIPNVTRPEDHSHSQQCSANNESKTSSPKSPSVRTQNTRNVTQTNSFDLVKSACPQEIIARTTPPASNTISAHQVEILDNVLLVKADAHIAKTQQPEEIGKGNESSETMEQTTEPNEYPFRDFSFHEFIENTNVLDFIKRSTGNRESSYVLRRASDLYIQCFTNPNNEVFRNLKINFNHFLDKLNTLQKTCSKCSEAIAANVAHETKNQLIEEEGDAEKTFLASNHLSKDTHFNYPKSCSASQYQDRNVLITDTERHEEVDQSKTNDKFISQSKQQTENRKEATLAEEHTDSRVGETTPTSDHPKSDQVAPYSQSTFFSHSFNDDFLLRYIARKCSDIKKQKIILERIKREVLRTENAASQVSKLDETQTGDALTKAKELYFRNVDKNHSLSYVMRTCQGLKASIVRALLQISLKEFVEYTKVYDADYIYNDLETLKACHNYVVKGQKVWPSTLYMPLKELFKYLKTKDIHFDARITALDVISPKFLHWSDLLRYTNFKECICLDYFKRTAEILDVNNTEMFHMECSDFYNRCYKHERWIWQVPVIQDLTVFDLSDPLRQQEDQPRDVLPSPDLVPTNDVNTSKSDAAVCEPETQPVEAPSMSQVPEEPQKHNTPDPSLTDTNQIEVMVEHNYVVMPNTQEQIDMLPTENSLSVDPLENNIIATDSKTSPMAVDGENAIATTKSVEVKQEKVGASMLNGLIFIENGSEEPLHCSLLSDEIVVLDSDEETTSLSPLDLDQSDEKASLNSLKELLSGSCENGAISEAQPMPSSFDTNNEATEVTKSSLSCSSDSVVGAPGQPGNADHKSTQSAPVVLSARSDHVSAAVKKATAKSSANVGDMVPQLTHDFRALPVKIVAKSTKQPESNNVPSGTPLAPATTPVPTISQEPFTDRTLLNVAELLDTVDRQMQMTRSTQPKVYLARRSIPLDGKRSSKRKSPTTAASGKVTQVNRIDKNSPFTTTRAGHNVTKLLLYREIYELNFFKKLTSTEIAQYELPTIGVGSRYMEALVSRGRFRIRLCNSPLDSLFSSWSPAVQRDFLAVLDDLNEYHYSVFERKYFNSKEDIRERIVHWFLDSSSRFSYSYLTYNTAMPEYGYCESIKYRRNPTFKQRKHLPLENAVRPSVLGNIVRLKARLSKQRRERERRTSPL